MIDVYKIIFYLIILLIFIFIFSKTSENYIDNKRINIVYFIYINHNRDWQHIVESQLNDILQSNILSVSQLNIVVVDEKEIVNKTYFDNILKDINYNIEFHNTNHFEYYGIKKIYDLAQDNPEKIYLYIHTKGMVFHTEKRNMIEKYLTNDIVTNYRKALKIFDNNENINKIGTVPANDGFIWFNFFFVRGIYLKNCNNPIISKNRYYYETYLRNEYYGDYKNDSYSLYADKIKSYTQSDAVLISTLNFTDK